MAARVVACLTLSMDALAWTPPTSVYSAARTRIAMPARRPRGGIVVSVESNEAKLGVGETLKLDEETVAAAAAAAADVAPSLTTTTGSADDARQQRIDAALAELARSGDQGRAAVAGGVAEPPLAPLPEAVVVPAWLSIAPVIMGGFSILLFVLNSFGVFGEGPNLDAF